MNIINLKEAYEFVYDHNGVQSKQKLKLPSMKVAFDDHKQSFSLATISKKNIEKINSEKDIKQLAIATYCKFDNGFFKRIYPSIKVTKSQKNAEFIIYDDFSFDNYKNDVDDKYCMYTRFHSKLLANKNILQIDNSTKSTSYYSDYLYFVDSDHKRIRTEKFIHIDDFLKKFKGNRINELSLNDARNLFEQIMSNSPKVKNLVAEVICGYTHKYLPLIKFFLIFSSGINYTKKTKYYKDQIDPTYNYNRTTSSSIDNVTYVLNYIFTKHQVEDDVKNIILEIANSDSFKKKCLNLSVNNISYDIVFKPVEEINLEKCENIDEFKV